MAKVTGSRQRQDKELGSAGRATRRTASIEIPALISQIQNVEDFLAHKVRLKQFRLSSTVTHCG